MDNLAVVTEVLKAAMDHDRQNRKHTHMTTQKNVGLSKAGHNVLQNKRGLIRSLKTE